VSLLTPTLGLVTREWNERADELAASAIAEGEPTAWFDRLYAEGAAGHVTMPWDREDPHPLLLEWADRVQLDGRDRRAVVAGCGLGADAEFLARRGFRTTAFDVAPTAVAEARSRHPGSAVDYRVADLFSLPEDLVGAFDLVVEIFTLQALPASVRPAAAAAVRSLVAPGGTLLAVAFRGERGPQVDGPPWPLSRAEMLALAAGDLTLVALEAVRIPEERWRAEYHREG
jgi:SAM-dependent methyltransferase